MKNNTLKILLLDLISSALKVDHETSEGDVKYVQVIEQLVDNYVKKIMNKIQKGEL